MELDGRLEGDKEEKLVVGSALHPILGSRCTLSQGTRLRALKENLDRTSIVVGIQELTSSELDLICDVAVASGDLGALPDAAAS